MNEEKTRFRMRQADQLSYGRDRSTFEVMNSSELLGIIGPLLAAILFAE